jgi:cytochrome c-type biogenesis protein CcsB
MNWQWFPAVLVLVMALAAAGEAAAQYDGYSGNGADDGSGAYGQADDYPDDVSARPHQDDRGARGTNEPARSHLPVTPPDGHHHHHHEQGEFVHPFGMTAAPPLLLDSPERITQFERFRAEVNPDNLARWAVHADGRVNSYPSYARSMMQFVSGPRQIEGMPAWFSYMELLVRSAQYDDKPIIYVKNKPMRERIASALRESFEHHGQPMLRGRPDAQALQAEAEQQLEEQLETLTRRGMISPAMLMDPFVGSVMSRMRQDLIRTARPVNELESALAVTQPSILRRNLKLLPMPGGDFHDPWLTFEDLREHIMSDRHQFAQVEMALKLELLDQWNAFQQGWREMDAARVNSAAARLAELLPRVNPELYPGEGSRAGWPWSIEERMDWKWTVSLGLSVFCLLMGLIAIIQRWHTTAALCVAGTMFAAVFHSSTLALGTVNPLPLESWYFDVRNMTWVWLLYALALVPLTLALVFRWEPARWVGMGLFLLGFAFHTAALLIRWYVSDRWPNSNMFEAVTTAAWWGGCAAIVIELMVRRLPVRGLFALGSAAGSMVALMCAYFMPTNLDPNIRNMMPVLHDVWLYIHVNVTILSYAFIFMAAVTAAAYLLYRLIGGIAGSFGSAEDYARLGGAGSMIETTPDGQTYITKVRSNLGQVLDGSTMVLVELSFILLWAGTVMGAIWADHSWGRPWGWDPKEVFALNTFIVFVILIHTRLKVKDKGLWTAIIALFGAGVMLFNWIAINFVITGLHSYA